MSRKERFDDPLAPIRRFARPAPERGRELDPFLCRHLQAKAWSLADATPEPALPRLPNARYRCLRTMRADGPDGALALPEDCIDERICFEPATRSGADS